MLLENGDPASEEKVNRDDDSFRLRVDLLVEPVLEPCVRDDRVTGICEVLARGAVARGRLKRCSLVSVLEEWLRSFKEPEEASRNFAASEEPLRPSSFSKSS